MTDGFEVSNEVDEIRLHGHAAWSGDWTHALA
jgi:hypothetical protein